MMDLESLNKTAISPEELKWLYGNGGSEEGILLFTSGLIDPFSGRQAVFFSAKEDPNNLVKIKDSHLIDQCHIGDKSLDVTNYGLIGASLLLQVEEI